MMAQRPTTELERLSAENLAWMNGVADFVEPMGFDREAACGPADLLPGLKFMHDYIEALLKALDHRHETGDAEPYFQARHDLEMALPQRVKPRSVIHDEAPF